MDVQVQGASSQRRGRTGSHVIRKRRIQARILRSITDTVPSWMPHICNPFTEHTPDPPPPAVASIDVAEVTTKGSDRQSASCILQHFWVFLRRANITYKGPGNYSGVSGGLLRCRPSSAGAARSGAGGASNHNEGERSEADMAPPETATRRRGHGRLQAKEKKAGRLLTL